MPDGELILEILLPMAARGLELRGVASGDIDHYLSIIERRVAANRTGARWQVASLDAMRGRGTTAEILSVLVESMHRQQQSGKPVDAWEAPEVDDAEIVHHHYLTVDRLMSTDLFTIRANEPVDLAAHLMNWRHVRHVPVEDDGHRLVGLVSGRTLLRSMADALAEGSNQTVLVRDIMQRDVVTVTPSTGTLEAMKTMKERKVSCLPVVDGDGRLVGILTERDFMGIAGKLLERFLADA